MFVQRMGLALMLAAAVAPLLASDSTSLARLAEHRVRIQSPALGPGWHEGLFNRTRQEPPCYLVLIFAPRRTPDAALQISRSVQLRDVVRLESHAAGIPASPSMAEWAGLPSPELANDARWRAVSRELLDANRDCPVRAAPGAVPPARPVADRVWQIVRVPLAGSKAEVVRDLDAELVLRLLPTPHARIGDFGWTVRVERKPVTLESRNLLYHSRYFHGPHPCDVLAPAVHTQYFPDERELPVYGYPYTIRIRVLRARVQPLGDDYQFVAGELEVGWQRLEQPNPPATE